MAEFICHDALTTPEDLFVFSSFFLVPCALHTTLLYKLHYILRLLKLKKKKNLPVLHADAQISLQMKLLLSLGWDGVVVAVICACLSFSRFYLIILTCMQISVILYSPSHLWKNALFWWVGFFFLLWNILFLPHITCENNIHEIIYIIHSKFIHKHIYLIIKGI